ncbi:YheC/YheD family protein [Paenibacillus solisilvae]|uniref:YheC/YheD family protein n=1 Tax=Paenibacillus solisilvae TaxID=2486751 RepID=A0ABW0VZ34_9BACL
MPQYIGSKLRKTEAILRNKSLRQFVPKTVRLNRLQLLRMLQQFKMVYVKPVSGTGGNGVMRVEKTAAGYHFQILTRKRSYKSLNAMYSAIQKETRGRGYLIQKGIHLLKYRGRRFDLRIMAQLNLRKRWETTGIIGRVAAPRKIVTNYHSGGTPTPVSRLLGSLSNKRKYNLTIQKLKNMGVTSGRAMKARFPGVCEVGVDVGLDSTLKPWILEVNTRPDPYIFRKLSDPSIFRKIRRYAKAYGRL